LTKVVVTIDNNITTLSKRKRETEMRKEISVTKTFNDDMELSEVEVTIRGGEGPESELFAERLPVLLTDAVLVGHQCWPGPCDEHCPKVGSKFYDTYDSPWD
jgi:hypothetical protein